MKKALILYASMSGNTEKIAHAFEEVFQLYGFQVDLYKAEGKKLSEKARTKLFGMVMQEVNHQLFSDSVKNECMLANEEASEQEIRELLEKFDLEEYAEYHPMILSGGQRQRLAICQAVMSGKKLLIFDEPTSGLDFRHMCQVEKLMKQLSEEKYIIIVVTHDYEFLNRACKGDIMVNSMKL